MTTSDDGAPDYPAVRFNGPCPFLMCPIPDTHAHPVCPECGAVRFGNVFGCETCKVQRKRWGINPTVGQEPSG